MFKNYLNLSVINKFIKVTNKLNNKMKFLGCPIFLLITHMKIIHNLNLFIGKSII